MDDDIHQLDTSDSHVPENDKYIIDMIFNNKPVVRSYHIKQIILATLLYSVMSLPMIDFILNHVIKQLIRIIELHLKHLYFLHFTF